ncbi:MAG: His/Gly/Thr/Pro-type tRNA ligase C-terminal domain-containing protein, partial [Methanobacterium sp.]
FEIAQDLRGHRISTDVDLARRKFKKLLSYADSLGVKYIILVGARDIEKGKVTVKNMHTGDQELVDLGKISLYLSKKLKMDG